MEEAASGLAAAIGRAASAVADAFAGASAGWLVLGLLVHLANQLARAQGWHALLRPCCRLVRRRDVLGAWVAGAGAGGILSARGGDATRVLLLSQRTRRTDEDGGGEPDAGAPVITGTLVAEAAGEAAVGAGLVLLAVAIGIGPGLALPAAPALWVGAGAAALAVLALVMVRRRRRGDPARRPAARIRLPRVHRTVAGVGRGCAGLRCPLTYARSVLPWQLASRALRGVAIGCFLVAFGLPATPAAVLLVMLAQGGGRILPFAPASVGATIAVVAAGFGPLTGDPASAAKVTAFLIGMSTLLTGVGAALTTVIVLRSADPRALGEALVAAWRARPSPAARPAPDAAA